MSHCTHGLGSKRTLTTLSLNGMIVPRSECHFFASLSFSKLVRPVLWGAKIEKAPPSVTYEEAMTVDDRGLYKWLKKIVSLWRLLSSSMTIQQLIGVVKDRFGFCLVSGVPPTAEATEELAKRISFIRETQCTRLITTHFVCLH